jgi:hypothetical protein
MIGEIRKYLLTSAKAASYRKSRSQTSFLTYFASTTPDSEHKRVRLKTMLFLQGSTYLDLGGIHARLQQHNKILQLEYAIIEGKVRSALHNKLSLILCGSVLAWSSSLGAVNPS